MTMMETVKTLTYETHLRDSLISSNTIVASLPLHPLGWGEFESLLKITYTSPTLKPTILKHTIRLYPQSTTGIVG